MNYNFVIYKIEVGKKIYIGSTWDYEKKIKTHMQYYKKSKNKLYNYINELEIEWEDLNIEILDKCFLNDKCEIKRRMKQQEFINKYNSNSKIEGLNSIDVYRYEEHKGERFKKYSKKYYHNHKSTISIKAKSKYQKNKTEKMVRSIVDDIINKTMFIFI